MKIKPDIIVLTETWLTDSDNTSLFVKNYNIFQTNRSFKNKKRGGGVLIFSKKCLDCSYVNDISDSVDDFIDIISIRIKLHNNNTPYIITGIYRAPDSNITYFNDYFYNLFLKYTSTNIFICGDFNINF